MLLQLRVLLGAQQWSTLFSGVLRGYAEVAGVGGWWCVGGVYGGALLLAVSMCFFDIHKALVRQRRETDNVETGRRKVRVLWVGGSLPDGCFNIKHETARC